MTTNKILVFIAVSLLIACAFGFYMDANANGVDVADCYAKVFVVTAIDYENDVIMLIDFNGDEWCYEGVEDWAVDDIACAIMYNNKTNLIYDDEIISLTYNGFIKEL